MKQHITSETLNAETLDVETSDDNILNAIFDDKVSIEELSIILQKLPTFIKYFIMAIHTNNNSEISKEEVNYLRDILKCSAITDVKSEGQGEAVQQAIEHKERNVNLAQKTNVLLKDKGIGEFKIAQAKSSNNGIISSVVAGYFIHRAKNDKEYQLRYVLKYIEKIGITISIYINGHNQDPQAFYDFMGTNPLKYPKKPVMNAKPGWYFYADIFNISDTEKYDAEYIAEKVADAYKRLNDYIAEKS